MSCHSERSEDELLRTCPKNLNTSTIAFQILRDAQDDNMIEKNHYNTPSFVFRGKHSKYINGVGLQCPSFPSSWRHAKCS